MNENNVIEYTSTNPIIQKCLDVLKSDKLEIKKVSDTNAYIIYCNNKHAFTIMKNAVFNAPGCVEYDLDVDNIKFGTNKYYEGLDFSDLKKLYVVCVSEYEKRTTQRRERVLNYLDNFISKDKSKETKNVKHVVQTSENKSGNENHGRVMTVEQFNDKNFQKWWAWHPWTVVRVGNGPKVMHKNMLLVSVAVLTTTFVLGCMTVAGVYKWQQYKKQKSELTEKQLQDKYSGLQKDRNDTCINFQQKVK